MNAIEVHDLKRVYRARMGVFGRKMKEVLAVDGIDFSLLLLFSGANLPLDKLPVWMQAVSAGLPLTRGIQSARLLVSGASLAEVWPLLAGELAVGLAYALAGFALFSWFEAQARRRGTLEAF
jgi:ABC-2 type transport system permease protein